MYEPVWIHPSDAEKRGIKNGDIVKVFNERGQCPGRRLCDRENDAGSQSMSTMGPDMTLLSPENWTGAAPSIPSLLTR